MEINDRKLFEWCFSILAFLVFSIFNCFTISILYVLFPDAACYAD